MQSQQLPTESQVLEDEVLPGTENADQPAEEMSERHAVAGGIGATRAQQESVSFSFPQVGISVPTPSYYQRDGVGHHFYGYRLTMGFAWQPI